MLNSGLGGAHPAALEALMRLMRQEPLFVIIAIGEQRTVLLQIVLVHSSRDGQARPGNRARRTAQGESGPQPGIEITIAERLLERGEGRLAGAVSGRHVSDFVRVA